MSLQRIKQIKLLKKLQDNKQYQEGLFKKFKNRASTEASPTSATSHKLNKNKKHMIEEERNTQIQKNNHILFQKIKAQALTKRKKKNCSIFKSIHQQSNTNQLNSRKHNRSQQILKQSKIKSTISIRDAQKNLRPKIKRRNQELDQQNQDQMQKHKNKKGKIVVLFQGVAQIDQISFKIKISVKNEIYYLVGRNQHTQILLQMNQSDYRQLHNKQLHGNPYNIFQYLQIQKGKLQFRTENQFKKKEEQKIINHNQMIQKKMLLRQMEKIEQQKDDLNKKYRKLKKKVPQKKSQIKNELGKYLKKIKFDYQEQSKLNNEYQERIQYSRAINLFQNHQEEYSDRQNKELSQQRNIHRRIQQIQSHNPLKSRYKLPYL